MTKILLYFSISYAPFLSTLEIFFVLDLIIYYKPIYCLLLVFYFFNLLTNSLYKKEKIPRIFNIRGTHHLINQIIYSLRFYQSLVLMMLHQLIHRRYLAVQIILVRWLQIQIHHTECGLLLL